MKKYLILILTLLTQIIAGAQNKGFEPVIINIDGSETKLYDESHALVIGISDYTGGWPSLPGVKKDVNAVKDVLKQIGFNVVVEENLTKDGTDKAFVDFISKYGQDQNNRLLFYFAGHGHTVKTSFGEVIGYIVPVDAPNPHNDLTGFQSKSMPMSRIEEYAKLTQSKHAIFFFDACFSGSLFSLSRAVPEVINYKTSKPVRQFITSGSEDETVPDESIFRQQFVTALTTLYADANNDGYLTGSELGKYLQDNVINYSRNSQHPQYGKIRNQYLDKGDFVFVLDKTVNNISVTIDNQNPVNDDETTSRYPKKLFGNIVLHSEISGTLYIDEKQIGTISAGSNVPVNNLEAGKHIIKIKGDQTWTNLIIVKKNQTIKIEASLSNNENNMPTDRITDLRDGKTYKLVKIGDQIWMAENLAYKTESACWAFNDDADNIGRYGYLYNWETAKNVCPDGFHLPSDAEWKQLEKEINKTDGPFDKGMDSWKQMGKLLKAKSGWSNDANGADKYGFNALPGGYCLSFEGEAAYYHGGRWWTSTIKNTTIAWGRGVSNRNDNFNRMYSDGKSWAFSVRCVRN